MQQWQDIIETNFLIKDQLSAKHHSHELKKTIEEVLHALDSGMLRVCEKINNQWINNLWVKQAILLSFKIFPNEFLQGQHTNFFDKVPLKFKKWTEQDFQLHQIRVVPDAHVRYGAYVAKNCVLMPSYINIGAHVDENTMVDTWATVGSCAQIGKNVHLSGGVGIGGVLEPLQNNPTIIEDNCFIGARSEIVEGVVIEQGSVIGMGVFISQSTKIYNRMTNEVSYGRIPAGSVVVSGSLPSLQGQCQLYCAVIVKQVDQKTREKTSINELLRDIVEC